MTGQDTPTQQKSKANSYSKRGDEGGGIVALAAILIALGAILLYTAGSTGIWWDQTTDAVAVNSKLASATQSSVSGLRVWRLNSDGIREDIGAVALIDATLQNYLDDVCERTVVSNEAKILSGKVFRVTQADCSAVTAASDIVDVSSCVSCSGAAPDCSGLELQAEQVARESGELGSCLGLRILAARAGTPASGQQVRVAAPLREAAPQSAIIPSASPSASSSLVALPSASASPTSSAVVTPTPTLPPASPPAVESPSEPVETLEPPDKVADGDEGLESTVEEIDGSDTSEASGDKTSESTSKSLH